ncbi:MULTISPECIES: High-affinity nickel transporter [unclassified Mesorhizobium]|uniref:High-affinity nickel transporter n=1 Tax=unclassified Mesorhizobium TaxID=325217 RepID=UPI00167959AE|nr:MULTISPECIES: High-affinity nickel transporter [unclassified Mesorhizobium]
MLVVLAALLAGFLHVLSGPDHMAAIAPYAIQGKARAWRTGVRWGFGHSAGVLGVGLLLLTLRDRIGIEALSSWGERGVGLMLIAIGLWGLRKAIDVRRAKIDHENHKHSVHGHIAFGVGTIHGLAGSSHLLGIVPALLLPSATAAAAYLIFFGVGTIAAMGGFAFAVGSIAVPPVARGAAGQSALMGVCSVLALGVGAFWLISAFGIHTAASLVALVTP